MEPLGGSALDRRSVQARDNACKWSDGYLEGVGIRPCPLSCPSAAALHGLPPTINIGLTLLRCCASDDVNVH